MKLANPLGWLVLGSVGLLAVLAATLATPADVVHADARQADEAVRRALPRLTNADPDVRVQAVADCARANNRSGAEAVLGAIVNEKDGPAGFAMAEHMAGFTSEEAHAAIERIVLRWRSQDQIYGAFWTFLALARQKTEGGDAILRKVGESSRRQDYFLRAAALEAIGFSRRGDLADVVVACLKEHDRTWENRSYILALTAVTAAGRVSRARDGTVAEGLEKEQRFALVLALADILEEYEEERLRYLTVQSLARITGEPEYIDPGFWRWWVQMGGERLERREPGATSASIDVPRFFGMPTVGNRIVFVIDISGSMRAPVDVDEAMRRPPEPPERAGPSTGRRRDRERREEEEARIPRPDYSNVQTRLDLAKVELIHALEHLPPDYMFNVVTYDTTHDLLNPSQAALMRATPNNKQAMIRRVQALEPRGATNIHGGIVRGFSIHERGMVDWRREDPATNEQCMTAGATTIFFLTDGFANVTDESLAQNPPQQGRGPDGPRLAYSPNIVAETARLNLFRKSVIHTVGIGSHDRGLMRALADLSGGTYVDRTRVSEGDFD
jgi:hypothetical protein